jgi:chaperonin GroES
MPNSTDWIAFAVATVGADPLGRRIGGAIVEAAWHSRAESASFPQPSPYWRLHSMKLKPLGDRLIVRAIEEEQTTASGILLPDTAKEKPQKGKVLAVGDGKVSEDTGKRIPLDVSEGDEVLYSKYGGTEIKVDGEDLLVLRESDVLAKVQS